MLRALLFILLLCFNINICIPQDVKAEKKKKKEKNAFGIQIKPIIPSSIFRIVTDQIKDTSGNIYDIKPENGYSFGATIRFGLTPHFVLQTDINYIKRNFSFSVTDGNFTSKIALRVVSYEIPVLATYFVRLSRDVYMGPTFGASFQFLPTNLYSKNEILSQLSLKKSWVSTSLVANVGFEWRTEDKGYFYFGPTYNMYFNPMFQTRIQYINALQQTKSVITELKGDYFGLVFRYIFAPK